MELWFHIQRLSLNLVFSVGLSVLCYDQSVQEGKKKYLQAKKEGIDFVYIDCLINKIERHKVNTQEPIAFLYTTGVSQVVLVVKNLAANADDKKDVKIPGSRRSPGTWKQPSSNEVDETGAYYTE